MSQENADTVRGVLEAFAKRDFERMFASLDPEIELDLSRRQMEPVIFCGHEGVREFLRQQREMWSDQRFEVMDCIDVGDNVVAAVRFVSTGRGGIEVAARAWFVWEVHTGLAVRATMYQSKDQALESAGLGETPAFNDQRLTQKTLAGRQIPVPTRRELDDFVRKVAPPAGRKRPAETDQPREQSN